MDKKLENRIARLEKLLNNSNRKPTLEQRIARLENAVNSNCRPARRKFEGFESDLDVMAAHREADELAREFGRNIGAVIERDDLDANERDVNKRLVMYSPYNGWLTINDISANPRLKKGAKFVFQYKADGYGVLVVPSDKAVELMTEGGYAVDPSGETFEADDPIDGAFPLSDWEGFDLSMVHDEDDEDYYESVKRSRRKSLESKSRKSR